MERTGPAQRPRRPPRGESAPPGAATASHPARAGDQGHAGLREQRRQRPRGGARRNSRRGQAQRRRLRLAGAPASWQHALRGLAVVPTLTGLAGLLSPALALPGLPGEHPVTVPPRGRAQLELRDRARPRGRGHQREEPGADLADPPPSCPPPRPARRQLGELGRGTCPPGAAPELRRQGQRRLAKRHAVDAEAARPPAARSAALIASQFRVTSSAPETVTSPNTCGCAGSAWRRCRRRHHRSCIRCRRCARPRPWHGRQPGAGRRRVPRAAPPGHRSPARPAPRSSPPAGKGRAWRESASRPRGTRSRSRSITATSRSSPEPGLSSVTGGPPAPAGGQRAPGVPQGVSRGSPACCASTGRAARCVVIVALRSIPQGDRSRRLDPRDTT